MVRGTGPRTLVGVAESPLRPAIGPWASSSALVAAAALACWALGDVVLPSTLSLVFLTAVLCSALRDGLWPSIYASLLSELVWNFFFIPPRFTLVIADPRDFLTFILFIVVSLAVSNLAASQRRQADAIRANARSTQSLYDFSQTISAIGALDALLTAVCEAIRGALGRGAVIAIEDHGGQARRAFHAIPEGDRSRLTDALSGISRTSWPEGAWSAPVALPSGHRCSFFRLRDLGGGAGVIGITPPPDSLEAQDRVLLTMMIEQAAIAIGRLQLARSIERSALEAEMERLRSAMLTSLSHDLRTPLTVIIGAQSALKSLDPSADAGIRAELLDRAQTEAERLNRFIGNLLDMTRLESGKLNMKLGPVDVIDAVESAVGRAAPLLGGHGLDIDLPTDLPMATADFMLLEQVVFNLLDNAAKYAPSSSTIRVAGKRDRSHVLIEIIDEGPGVPSAVSEAIFDKFTRPRLEDRKLPGTGLGLAICRGFLSAMGGTISVGNRDDRSGAIFTVALPIAEISEMALAQRDV